MTHLQGRSSRGSLAFTLTVLCAALLLFLLSGSGGGVHAEQLDTFAAAPTPVAPLDLPPGLSQQAERQGTVRVIATLLGRTGVQAAAAQNLTRAEIAAAQDAVMVGLEGFTAQAVRRYEMLPLIGLELDQTALAALASLPEVTAIQADAWVVPGLADSVPLVRADDAHALGATGQGQTIAILDTGVDRNHPALTGKVVSEACFATTFGNSSTTCPNGQDEQLGTGAAAPCSHARCRHGTHVAGIAAGNSLSPQVRGVAPDANIIAIQVFSTVRDDAVFGRTCSDAGESSPCIRTNLLDYIAGLDRVIALRNTFRIAAVNMSLGGGRNTSTCNLDPTKLAIDNLRGSGILTVIAAGNDNHRDALASPACISSAISVGATTKGDQVATFSNMASFMTLLAPGQDILSSVPGGGTLRQNGTSMAAPHVAGALAVIREVAPLATTSQIVNALTSTGPSIRDTRSGGSVTKRRLDVIAALASMGFNDADDLRTLAFGSTLNGTIAPAGERDTFHFRVPSAGLKATVSLERTSGDLDPFLTIVRPNGTALISDDNSGSGANALLNLVDLPDLGTYRIQVRAANANPNTTGQYRISLSLSGSPINPEPTISSLSPNRTTSLDAVAPFIILRVDGKNFISGSVVRWNGSNRSTSFISSSRLMATIPATDYLSVGTANVRVFNPAPGGGSSNTAVFTIATPFLGEPAVSPNSGVSFGNEVAAFDINWTVSEPMVWRDLNTVDFRLRSADNDIPLWVRVIEQPGADSMLYLLNGAGELLGSGLPGAYGSIAGEETDLLLEQSQLTGSGPTGRLVSLHLVIHFRDAVQPGSYTMEMEVSKDDGSVQGPDVVGIWRIGEDLFLPLIAQ